VAGIVTAGAAGVMVDVMNAGMGRVMASRMFGAKHAVMIAAGIARAKSGAKIGLATSVVISRHRRRRGMSAGPRVGMIADEMVPVTAGATMVAAGADTAGGVVVVGVAVALIAPIMADARTMTPTSGASR
jgi:hypothetical protein